MVPNSVSLLESYWGHALWTVCPGTVLMATPSKTSIYSALAGNVAVGAAKLLAFFFSGSSSMLVESIHSAIDTLNQGLLLFGMNRSARPPDAPTSFRLRPGGLFLDLCGRTYDLRGRQASRRYMKASKSFVTRHRSITSS